SVALSGVPVPPVAAAAVGAAIAVGSAMAVGAAIAVGSAAVGAAVGAAAAGAAVGSAAAGAAVGAAAGIVPPHAARSMPSSITTATALRNLWIRIEYFSLFRKRVIPDEQQ